MPSDAAALQALAEAAARCAKCGACTAVCPIYRLTGREALASRGRLHLLARLPAQQTPSPLLAEILSQCLLCGACADACPRGIDLPMLVMRARHALAVEAGEDRGLRRTIRKVLAHPLLLTSASAAARMLPDWSGLRLRLAGLQASLPASHGADLPPTALREKGKPAALLFAGCFALYLQKDIIAATNALVRDAYGAGLTLPEAQRCCGLAAASAGDLDSARELAAKNIAVFSGSAAPILVSCASCFSHLAGYPELFAKDAGMRDTAQAFAARLREFSSFLAAAPRPLAYRAATDMPERRVLYHDPCHLRFRHRIATAPRQLLAMVPGLRLEDLDGGPRCCGQGGLFHLAHPGLAQGLREDYRAALRNLLPDQVVTTCTGCILGLGEILGSKNAGGPQVKHLASFLAEQKLASSP